MNEAPVEWPASFWRAVGGYVAMQRSFLRLAWIDFWLNRIGYAGPTWPARRAFRRWAHRRSVVGIRNSHGGEYAGWGLCIVRDGEHPGWAVHVCPPNEWRHPLAPADARRYGQALIDAAAHADELDGRGRPDEDRGYA